MSISQQDRREQAPPTSRDAVGPGGKRQVRQGMAALEWLWSDWRVGLVVAVLLAPSQLQ